MKQNFTPSYVERWQQNIECVRTRMHERISVCLCACVSGLVLTLGACRTWWAGTRPRGASWTAALRWAASGRPAARWRRTTSSRSSRPSPGCECCPPPPPCPGSPASCPGNYGNGFDNRQQGMRRWRSHTCCTFMYLLRGLFFCLRYSCSRQLDAPEKAFFEHACVLHVWRNASSSMTKPRNKCFAHKMGVIWRDTSLENHVIHVVHLIRRSHLCIFISCYMDYIFLQLSVAKNQAEI